MTHVELEVKGKSLYIETGRFARQADGSVIVRYGDTVVLATAVAAKTPRENIDFFPLTIDYQEKAYAAGKIPGGFFKREGRPTEKEVLTSRLIDRPIRPLFPDGFHSETQGIVSVLSYGDENIADVLGIVGMSAALGVSDIPFEGIVGAVRVGIIESSFVVNPDLKETEECDFNLVVAGTDEAVLMVEGGGLEIKESIWQEALNNILKEIIDVLNVGENDISRDIANVFDGIEKTLVRNMILEKNLRADGRKPEEIRNIICNVGILPRTHGSALFIRGETQCLAVVTLGTSEDEQRIDSLDGESSKTFMLHYNFPPFSVGEVKPLRSPGRREIGHGMLAERAVKAVIPTKAEFPYTIRIVSDILESNGSSSMATVCGSSLALMDAGVPVKSHVAGIAMGLIKEDDRVVILTDILGLEDHLGDMDFKVTGTEKGITSFQMDTKISGISREITEKALDQARQGRLYILAKMSE